MTTVADVPLLGEVTSTEVHAAILGAVGLLLGVTRAWSQVRREPWYAFASFLATLGLGIAIRRRRHG